MPVVHVHLFEGRSKDAKKRIISGITDVFVREGVPAEAVTIVLHDLKKENYGQAGRSADDS